MATLSNEQIIEAIPGKTVQEIAELIKGLEVRFVIAFVYIYGIIGSYQVFDQVFVMTNGGPVYSTTTIVFYLFRKFQDLRLGYASAIAYVLFAILVIFSYVQLRFSQEKE